jgi:hypothetical protein
MKKSCAPSTKFKSEINSLVPKSTGRKKQKTEENPEDGANKATAQALVLFLKKKAQKEEEVKEEVQLMDVDKENAGKQGKNVRLTEQSPPLYFACKYRVQNKLKDAVEGMGKLFDIVLYSN